MKVLASTTSPACTELVLKAGAQELYMGLDDPAMSVFTFTGRGRTSPAGKMTVQSEDQFRQSVDLAHAAGVPVFLAANLFYLADPDEGGFDLPARYVDYVRRGLDLGADAVITADVGAVRRLREAGITAPLHSSSFMRAYTVEDALFLKELGINRVILPSHVTAPEIEAICTIEGLEVEVFGFWCCSNVESGCLLWHAVGENHNFGLFCRNLYDVEDGETIRKNLPFLDAGQDCSLCSLAELARIGVDSVKVFGREMDPTWVASCVKIIRSYLDDVLTGELSSEAARAKLLKRVPWYGEFCKEDRGFPALYRCKYIEKGKGVGEYFV